MIDKICEAYRHELEEIGDFIARMTDTRNRERFCAVVKIDGCVNSFRKLIEPIISAEKVPEGKPVANYAPTLPTDYDPTKRMTREEALANPQPVCVLTDADGEPQGVLVQTLGEQFVIEPKDFNDGEEMAWDDAMAALKEAGKTTFNKQQAYIILFLRKNVNAALSSIDGDELASGHWAATEYTSSYAWYVGFGSGGFGNNSKYHSFVVRAVAAF